MHGFDDGAVLANRGPAAFIEQLAGDFGFGPFLAPRGGKLDLFDESRHDQQQQQKQQCPNGPAKTDPTLMGLVARIGPKGRDRLGRIWRNAVRVGKSFGHVRCFSNFRIARERQYDLIISFSCHSG